MTDPSGVGKGESKKPDLLFLAWDSPWPARWGGAVRTLGLLTELSKTFDVELLLMTREPLSDEQSAVFGAFSDRMTRIPRRGVSGWDRIRVALGSLMRGRPYHCGVIETSLHAYPDVLNRVLDFPGVVYASYGHWGTLVHGRVAKNWILDQQHADADSWRVYARQVSSPFSTAAALVNWRLSLRHFRRIYPGVGRVVSVCDEDKRLTLELAPGASVDVIENGVDCAFYAPCGKAKTTGQSVLFVGTAAPRNLEALKRFVGRILPLIRRSLPSVQMVIGGELGPREQARFSEERDIVFTGPLDDLREVFHRSDVFVVPHAETHGSQLKVAVAMAMGMPIVSTAQGVRGMPVIGGQSALIAADDEEFAAHVVALLNDGPLRARLGAAARQAALARLDWRVLGPRLTEMVESVARAAVAR